jgi:hypothetical protein
LEIRELPPSTLRNVEGEIERCVVTCIGMIDKK